MNDSDYQNATQVQGAITTEIGKLATVAKTGSYTDLTNKPTIPTTTTDLTFTLDDGTETTLSVYTK